MYSVKTKNIKKCLGRRIKRLVRKPKFLKARSQILEVPKFSLICFIGQTDPNTPPNFLLWFQMAVKTVS